mmetsp:Transcript_12118/g.18122  ORF Transcript_12118/g.18122 Transcript_12118/m.18122 type:complete len:157 (-) Transcript_12118:25-495(-)|eukprot:CAMPEP_0171462408 /NCGR_PEP_ID=MMETSP0945-20130129/6455_1 /TAXON_ID=109269 /ORGANISM="Vaucheria litorea, Strain CCMP2940" /LENGTH=156 /DNA_ID=CAMNT_0011988923 /DNA_START=57 /DNA_END=527 /DNA_ORIENTATION=-
MEESKELAKLRRKVDFYRKNRSLLREKFVQMDQWMVLGKKELDEMKKNCIDVSIENAKLKEEIERLKMERENSNSKTSETVKKLNGELSKSKVEKCQLLKQKEMLINEKLALIQKEKDKKVAYSKIVGDLNDEILKLKALNTSINHEGEDFRAYIG